jgi:hypothetical protein
MRGSIILILALDAPSVLALRLVGDYGRTYQFELPPEKTFDWRCRKNADDDPSITCERTPATE